VTGIATSDDGSRSSVERREQSKGSMARIVVRAPLNLSWPHGEKRLRSVEGLDLTFLVDAENQRALWRRQVQAYDIAHLLDEERIGGELKCFGAMRLEVEGFPYPMDRRGREACGRECPESCAQGRISIRF
jgi:hypothetical protein